MKKLIISFIFVMLFIPTSILAWDNIGYYSQYQGSSYDSDNCETSGRYSFTKWGEAASSITWYRGVSPTDYSGYAAGSLNFTFRRDLDVNKFYDIRIRFNGKDVRPYITADSIDIYTGTTQCRVQPGYQSDLSMISFINNATTDENSDYLQLRLYASVPISNWQINISQARQSTSTNWGVKDIIYREVDMSGNNAIIENNTINSNNIINNNKQNTQDIINNNNQNTQDIISSNQVCSFVDKNNVISWGKYIAGYNGEVFETSNMNKGITDFIKLTNQDKLNILTSNNYEDALVFYNINKQYISRILVSDYNNQEVVIPNDTNYIRLTIEKTSNKPTLSICKNGNQALTDTFSDDSIPTGNDFLDELNEMLPTDNTISNLITLPLSLYSKVLDSINGTCSSISLGSLYNTDLVMPCIDISSYVGNNIWSLIDAIISGGFVIIIAKKMVKAFHSFSELKEGDVIGND